MSATVTPSRDPLRAQLHQMWSGVAGAWAAHLGYIDSRGAHGRPDPGRG